MCEFLILPTETFVYSQMPSVESANTQIVYDAELYASAVSELSHKIRALCAFLEYKDTYGPYEDVTEACQALVEWIKVREDFHPDAKRRVFDIISGILGKFKCYSLVCMAHAILPEQPRRLATIFDELDYMYAASDSLFHLARLDSVSMLFKSGYIDPSMSDNVKDAYGALLSNYKEAMGRLLQHAC